MSAEDFQYATVTFNGRTVCVVATAWMVKLETGEYLCYWPTNNQTTRAQKQEIPDKSNWQVHGIKSVLFFTDDWNEVKVHCRTDELTSDIDSDSENVDSAKLKKRYTGVRYIAEETNGKEGMLPQKKRYACDESEQYRKSPTDVVLSQKLPVSTPAICDDMVYVTVKEEFPQSNKRLCVSESATNQSPVNVFHPQKPTTSTISADTSNERVSSRTAMLRTPEPKSLFNSESPERKEENVIALLQKISTKIDAMMMQQDALMLQQNALKLQQNAMKLQQDEMMFQQNEMMPQQDAMMLQQDSIMLQQEKMLKELMAIRGEISHLHVGNENNEAIIIEDLLPQPLTQESDLTDLNTKLKLDQSFRTKMVEIMSRLGGSDCGGTVRRIMKKIGTNSLWSLYSLKGRKHKIPFLQHMELYTVILKSCFKTHPLNIKETDVQFQIAETLKHAPNKPDGSRHKRSNQQQEMVLQVIKDEVPPADLDLNEKLFVNSY